MVSVQFFCTLFYEQGIIEEWFKEAESVYSRASSSRHVSRAGTSFSQGICTSQIYFYDVSVVHSRCDLHMLLPATCLLATLTVHDT